MICYLLLGGKKFLLSAWWIILNPYSKKDIIFPLGGG